MKEQIQAQLQKYGLTPKHIFGQNFLIDESVLDKIVEVSGVVPGDKIVEVGPGVGNLTRKLLEKGAEVLAVEKDENFKPILRSLGKEYPGQLNVMWGDALKIFNKNAELLEFIQVGSYKIIGNIPYYITGKLVPMLFALDPLPFSITLLVQKEVAERMTAGPGDMSLLSLAVQMKSEATYELTVPARSFYPAPKVDSGVVKLQIADFGMKIDKTVEVKIFKLAKAAFLGKRKTLLNTLSGNLGYKKEEVEDALAKCGIDPKTRPQELSLHQWLELSKILL